MNGEKLDSAIIVGGGIGGLCAAIALLNIGIKVKVYEKAGQLKAVGAGMSLDPNGSHALTRLGLEKQVQALVGATVDGIGIRDGRDGRWLSYISITALQNRFGIAPMGVYRPILQEFLLEAVAERGGTIECGVSCTGFEQDSQAVRVYFANGSSDTAALLVGADGIHSKIRQQLWGGQPVRPANQIYWRSAIEFDHNQLQTPGELWGAGRGLVFGAMPVQRGMVHWYAIHNTGFGRALLEQANPEEVKEWLQNQFSSHWVKICQELISRTPATAIIRTEIFDLNPLKQWSQGRVTLLGDAAHAMNPAFGQGASQAAEDAVALAEALQKFPQLPAALQYYEQLRIKRTTKLIKQARMLGKLMQLENPGLARARNRFLRLAFAGERTSLQQLQWLYDYNFN